MDNSFITYLQRLELIGFFSGYALLYSIIIFWSGSNQPKNSFKNRVASLLPYAYALAGTLYLGLQLKEFYQNNDPSATFSFLKVWGLLSILFWIPALSKKNVFSLIHSLVFLFLPVKDIVLQKISSTPDTSILRNDMKIYSASLLLNLVCLLLILSLSFLSKRTRPL